MINLEEKLFKLDKVLINVFGKNESHMNTLDLIGLKDLLKRCENHEEYEICQKIKNKIDARTNAL